MRGRGPALMFPKEEQKAEKEGHIKAEFSLTEWAANHFCFVFVLKDIFAYFVS